MRGRAFRSLAAPSLAALAAAGLLAASALADSQHNFSILMHPRIKADQTTEISFRGLSTTAYPDLVVFIETRSCAKTVAVQAVQKYGKRIEFTDLVTRDERGGVRWDRSTTVTHQLPGEHFVCAYLVNHRGHAAAHESLRYTVTG